jgi:heterodisulfide reductase subunit A
MHEPTFRRACQDAGLNPYLLEMTNIREHCSWVHEDGDAATEKAKALVSAAVRRVFHQQPLESKEVPVNPNTLVVGGGISGIQAALEIADSGHQVYLVEREPSIGGHMAQFDKTFPTLDCAACILTPKMTAVGQHPFIQLLSYSEVVDVSGYVGNFKVKIKKKARYVDEAKCTACGECVKACPVEVESEFDQGLSKRKAIYIPFPQAVPNKYTIDKKIPPCKAACPVQMDVQGYLVLIALGKFKEAYQLIRRTNPLPAICGRVCYHPCETACRRNNLDEPLAIRTLKRFAAEQIRPEEVEMPQISRNGKKVAIIGSGPAGLTAAHDLALLGYEVTIFESLPQAGGMLRAGIPAYRLPRNILEQDIRYIEKLGVKIKTNTKVGEQVTLEELRRSHSAIFIATGAHESLRLGIPGEEAEGVIPGVDFLKAVNLGNKVSLGSRIAVIGGGNTAIDAARVARRLGADSVTIVYRRSREEMPASPEEVKAAEEEGVQILFLAAPTRVIMDKGRASGLECLKMMLGEPDATGRRRPIPVKGSEFTIPVDTVIPALGQAPRLDFARKLGLAVSERGTLVVDQDTLATSVAGIFAGGDVVSGPATVIEGMAAGRKAARSIDRYLNGEPLVLPEVEGRKAPQELTEAEVEELRQRYPAHPRVKMAERAPEQRSQGFGEAELGYTAEQAQEEALRCLACGVCSGCRECEKLCEANAIDHEMRDEIIEVEVGNIIVATGYDLFDARPMMQYGYKRLDNVLSSLEFERMCNAAGPTGGKILLKNGTEPESVAIIHCVGSRDKNYHEYCSRVCCMYSMKFAHLVREKTRARVYEFYIDLRSFGKGYEEFYNRVLEEGTVFIRGKVAEVTDVAETPEEKGKLIVQFEDTLIGQQRRLPVDMVILSSALQPRADAAEVARLFSLSRSAEGFFMEKHPKLDPVATMTDGVFIAGCAQGPKDIPDAVAQGSAAAARALAMITKGKIEIEAATAFIDETVCAGCRICNDLCAYKAIEFDPAKKVSRVNEARCKGCGVCAAACPSGAITSKQFTTEQIMAEIEGVLV